MRKNAYFLLTIVLVVTMLGVGSVTPTVQAAQPTPEATSEFPVTVEFTGVVHSITHNQLTLADGTVFTINKDTTFSVQPLKIGATVTVVAAINDDGMVAVSVGSASSDAPSVSATADASQTGPGNSGDSNGNGNGNSNGNGKGHGKGKGNNSNDNSGNSSNGNGKGNNGKGNGNGNGKNKGKNDDNNVDNNTDNNNGDANGDSGKGNKTPDEVAACLKNTTHPVATRLAEAFGVDYNQIMNWHCQGFGFGEVSRAYLLAQHSNLTVAQIFAMRKAGQGWGKILKGLGLKMKDLGANPIGHGKGHKGNNGNNGNATATATITEVTTARVVATNA